MLPKAVLYYGKDEPLPEQVPLRAGPLTLVYEAGDLRYIKLGEHEILRRIYVAIRDRNWGTMAPAFSNVSLDVGADSFRIAFDAANIERPDLAGPQGAYGSGAGGIDFRWHGTITGDADGTITFGMDGAAHSTFWRNRIGFCVLHPAAAAGAAAVVERVDGAAVTGSLPTYIEKAQPVMPFADMQAMRHEVTPGVWAEVRFAGDVFEMEDQRNWTDASYKTFCTPLRLPFPVEIQAGTRVAQSITVKLVSEPGTRLPAEAGPGRAAQGVTVTLDPAAAGVPLPRLGLGMASHDEPLSAREMARLRALHLGHLRVDLHLNESGYAGQLRRAAEHAAGLGLPLEAALFLTANADAELAALAACLDEIQPPLARWLVYPARELFGGGSPVAQAVRAARQGLGHHLDGVPLGSGTNSDLILLQRSLPPVEFLDLLTLAINPQVHAFDNASLVETLEAQGMVVASARRLAGGLPVIVSPVTLKPRFNPVATGPIPPVPPGELPPQVDPRQMSLLAAGWTLGSLKYLAEAGAASVTYYETTGWRGVMATEAGSPIPEKFPALPGSVYPVYHVLADVGEFAGGQVLPARSSDNLAVEALALTRDGRRRLLVANMTGAPQRAHVGPLGPQARVCPLNETNALAAMREPEAYRGQAGDVCTVADGGLTLDLLPYAVARIDL